MTGRKSWVDWRGTPRHISIAEGILVRRAGWTDAGGGIRNGRTGGVG